MLRANYAKRYTADARIGAAAASACFERAGVDISRRMTPSARQLLPRGEMATIALMLRRYARRRDYHYRSCLVDSPMRS